MSAHVYISAIEAANRLRAIGEAHHLAHHVTIGSRFFAEHQLHVDWLDERG
jgi:hypothetical protein